MKRISVPLSTQGVNSLLRKIEDYRNWLRSRTAVFLDRLAQEGMKAASVKFAQAVYDGTNDVSVSVENRGTNARAVVALGQAVLFIEFGTGVTYPDNHPLSGELGMRRGSYGAGYGKRPAWGYYGEPGTNGVIQSKSNGGIVVITRGNPANQSMYETVKELETRLTEIAKEVYS